jgi:hypothetical protein
MTGKFVTAAILSLSLAMFAQGSFADSADPDYAAKQCYKDKRDVKECWEEVLDGDKKEIAQCVKLVTDKRKAAADKKAAASKQ